VASIFRCSVKDEELFSERTQSSLESIQGLCLIAGSGWPAGSALAHHKDLQRRDSLTPYQEQPGQKHLGEKQKWRLPVLHAIYMLLLRGRRRRGIYNIFTMDILWIYCLVTQYLDGQSAPV